MALKLLCASSLLALSGVTPSLAQAAIKHQIEIPSQELRSALASLAQQTKIQLIYPAALVEGRKAQALTGSMTPEEALQVLLEPSHLRFEFLDEQTVTLAASAGSGVAMPVAHEPPSSIRVAQAQLPGAQNETHSEVIPPTSLQQVVVTGSRLENKGDTPAPVVTFTREKLNALGITQIADVLNYLPQQSFQKLENDSFAGGRPVQLRGLGLGTTLVLINGRRTVSSAAQGARAFFDLNMLPLAAVERIEILSDSASSIYGADAVGGVLNIVLKKTIEHPTIDVSYNDVQDGGDERQATFSVGAASDRFSSILVMDYLERDVLYGLHRDMSHNMDYRRFGPSGRDLRVPRTNPGNVCSASGANLPGLPTACAAVPNGSSGVGLTPADFLGTAGVTNLGSSEDATSLIPSLRRSSVTAVGEYAMTSTTTAFAELMYVDREDVRTRTYSDLGLRNVLVPASNPHNPFGVPVRVNYALNVDAFGLREEFTESDGLRSALGVKGDHGGWSWEVSALYSNERARSAGMGELDLARINASLQQTDPALALNVFQDGAGGSDALLDSFRIPGGVTKLRSRSIQLNQFARRSLFSLPAGEVQAVVGAEQRRETLNFDSLNVDRDALSAFVEARVPLLSDKRWAQELTLTASGRYDDYNDIGGAFNPQYGLVWRANASLLLRGSYGESFRAPSLFELYQPMRTSTSSIRDPRRSESVPVAVVTGGSESLEAEESESYSFGFVFTPRWAEGLSLSATYWSVEQSQRVVRSSPLLILANEAYFPDRVLREAPSPADVAAGLPGRLISLMGTNLNAGGLHTKGVDIDLRHSVDSDWGRFSPFVTATWVETFTAADFPTTPVYERVSLAQLSATIPRWRLVGGLSWSRRAVNLSISGRYVAPYADTITGAVRSGGEVSPATLWDVQGSFELDALGSWLSGATLRVGAINVFDEMAPFSASSFFGYDPSAGDLRGRNLYIKATKAFGR